MIDPRCVEYVRTNAGKYPLDALRAALIKAGVKPEDADDSIRAATAPPPAPSPEPAPAFAAAPAQSAAAAPVETPAAASAPREEPPFLRSCFERARLFTIDPWGFYRTMPQEGGWQDPLLFALVMAAAMCLIELVGNTFKYSGAYGGLRIFASAALAAWTLVVIPIATIIGAAVSHVVWMVLGSKKSYETSLRCVAYGTALLPVQGLVHVLPIVGTFLYFGVLLYRAYTFVPASVEVHGLPRGRVYAVFAVMAAFVVGAGALAGLVFWKARNFVAGAPGQSAAFQAMIRSAQATAGQRAPAAMPTPAQLMTPVSQVSVDAIKALMPAQVPGFPKSFVTSTASNLVPGQTLADVRANYTNDAPRGSIQIDIVDAQGMGQMLGALAGAAQFDQSTADGFSRTLLYKGFKGVEVYGNAARNGHTQIIVANRYLVKVTGSGVESNDIRAALDALDLNALAQLH